MLGTTAYTAHVVLPEARALRRDMALPSNVRPPAIPGGTASTPSTACPPPWSSPRAGGTGRRRLGSARVADGQVHDITLIPGDGIGPEVTRAVVQVLEAAGLRANWERTPPACSRLERARHGAAGGTARVDPPQQGRAQGAGDDAGRRRLHRVNVGLRKALDLYANLRPVWNLPGVQTRYEGVDLVIVRENTEDLYAGLEHMVVPGVVESLKIITERASTRIARFAFEYARRHGRKRVTAVHKANIMKLSDGLFLDCARRVAEGLPRDSVRRDDRRRRVHAAGDEPGALRHAAAGEPLRRHRLGPLRRPGRRAGRGAGREHRRRRRGVFEAVHGTAPDIAGKGLANPTGAAAVGAC